MKNIIILGTGSISENIYQKFKDKEKIIQISWRDLNFFKLAKIILKYRKKSNIIICGFNKNLLLKNFLSSIYVLLAFIICSYKGKIIYLNTHCLALRKYNWSLNHNYGFSEYLLVKYIVGIILSLYSSRNFFELFITPVIDEKFANEQNLKNNNSYPFYAISIKKLVYFISEILNDQFLTYKKNKYFVYSNIINEDDLFYYLNSNKVIKTYIMDFVFTLKNLILLILKDTIKIILKFKFNNKIYLKSLSYDPLNGNPFPDSKCLSENLLKNGLRKKNIILKKVI